MGDEVEAAIRRAIKVARAERERERPTTRELSLVLTKLEEALLWRLGDPGPEN